MAKSKTTTKKTATKQPPKANLTATVPDGSPSGKKRNQPAAARRVPVQYTPRIPSARCPGC